MLGWHNNLTPRLNDRIAFGSGYGAVHIYNERLALLGTLTVTAGLIYIVLQLLAGLIHDCIGKHHIARNPYSAHKLGYDKFVIFLHHKVGLASGMGKSLLKVDGHTVGSGQLEL